MAESISITHGAARAQNYAELLPQVEALIEGEPDAVAAMANASAAIHQAFGFHWVGFYVVRGDELVLGPFQGPVACMRIGYGKGVCGTAWARAETVIVPDVDSFPGHIACSSASRSEIVVPVVRDGQVLAVLDVDSAHLSDFSGTDAAWLAKVATLIAPLL